MTVIDNMNPLDFTVLSLELQLCLAVQQQNYCFSWLIALVVLLCVTLRKTVVNVVTACHKFLPSWDIYLLMRQTYLNWVSKQRDRWVLSEREDIKVDVFTQLTHVSHQSQTLLSCYIMWLVFEADAQTLPGVLQLDVECLSERSYKLSGMLSRWSGKSVLWRG